jgi:hypothetical protein
MSFFSSSETMPKILAWMVASTYILAAVIHPKHQHVNFVSHTKFMAQHLPTKFKFFHDQETRPQVQLGWQSHVNLDEISYGPGPLEV